ncbi:MAG: PTS sugar transporter subunit IIA [Myxococcales bacterium]|nr:PTS sugar transporter subunit IIA [Myxococcales bacterium]
MIGVLIVTHYGLGDELLNALHLILGEIDGFLSVGVDPVTPSSDTRERLEKALREVDSGEGVLVLVDMFGGTPSNLCLSFLEEGRIEVVTGVNLPMLVKIARSREGASIHSLAELACEYGRKNISVASDVLAGRASGEIGADDGGSSKEESA